MTDPAGEGIGSDDGEEIPSACAPLHYASASQIAWSTMCVFSVELIKKNEPLDLTLACQQFTYDTFVKI